MIRELRAEEVPGRDGNARLWATVSIYLVKCTLELRPTTQLSSRARTPTHEESFRPLSGVNCLQNDRIAITRILTGEFAEHIR